MVNHLCHDPLIIELRRGGGVNIWALKVPNLSPSWALRGPSLGPEKPKPGPIMGPERPKLGPIIGPERAKLGPIMGPEKPQLGPIMGPEKPKLGQILGPERPKIGPIMGPERPKLGPIIGLWGAEAWAHHGPMGGPSLGQSSADGGGGQAGPSWPIRGPNLWLSQTYTTTKITFITHIQLMIT
jgi:hypothetical protein